MNLLITGGAGFVGSNLAIAFAKKYPNYKITCLDNLKRRGSELNLKTFKSLGIEFVHGDIRNVSDLADLKKTFDFIIEASAEPSVLAGLNSSPQYLLDTNLVGTMNCLEFARNNSGGMIFLSTSRVYSIEAIKEIPLIEADTRFEIGTSKSSGLSNKGISEDFETRRARSLYGTTKLASEMLLQEYFSSYGYKSIINRCGVIAGPGQFGKVDQGVFTLWVANHHFKKPLKYTGFGGKGKQVRDLLHPSDLFALLEKQIESSSQWNAESYNVGGGREISVSMLEMTKLCEAATSNSISMTSDLSTASVDIPLYLSDSSKVSSLFGWSPKVTPAMIVSEISNWIKTNEAALRDIF